MNEENNQNLGHIAGSVDMCTYLGTKILDDLLVVKQVCTCSCFYFSLFFSQIPNTFVVIQHGGQIFSHT